MKIKFCGAARTVTGSQHLLEINDRKILLDCGLYQGKREEAYQINKSFLFDPAEIHAVVLSHAHIDHSGNLPTLIAKEFKGNIYSTTATRDLCAIMLQDSAHIQEKDTEYVNKKRAKKHEPLFKPLYTLDNVRDTMKKFKAVSYDQQFFIDNTNQSVAVTFFDAGHILGSAQVLLSIVENGKTYKFAFSGDIGRAHLPILKDPEFIGDVNYIISESTYGGRVHDKATEMDTQLEITIKEALQRGGKIIVPAFSVGRTQEVVYSLSKLFNSGALPRFPIFVDSPLSVNVSDVFKLHHECFDKETSELISKGVDIFGFSNLTYIKDVEESKALNNFKGPCMIISASGMAEAGRILHHLANNIEDPASTILIIGFMAPETLGRRLIESRDVLNPLVKIFGDEHHVMAKVVVLNSFSAHADRNELQQYFAKFDKKKLESIFLVHGDYDQQQALQSMLKSDGFNNIEIPEKGSEYNI
ncbi:MAG: MBL fold metallo-hydrolase [Ignavibacteriae bacterium]|nr:MAG: MBL fold metallo-hydrolase [Ignavibacteriota bacterium]